MDSVIMQLLEHNFGLLMLWSLCFVAKSIRKHWYHSTIAMDDKAWWYKHATPLDEAKTKKRLLGTQHPRKVVLVANVQLMR